MSIDYGMRVTNIDAKTGIRYGVIPQNEVLQAWADSSTPVYDESAENDDFAEPIGYVLNEENLHAEIHDGDWDIFITKSPFYTLCGFCSPCAPGAGYLMTEGSVKAYCFGHDWFDEGKAPYRVFSVETGEEITAMPALENLKEVSRG